jgi:hypothetical protein
MAPGVTATAGEHGGAVADEETAGLFAREKGALRWPDG